MTDGEPEPFMMSTGPEDTSEDEAPDERPDGTTVGDDEADAGAVLPGGVESIADLIDEASRTAAEQAVQAATGTAPEDRSSDVWGSLDDDDEDLDAVWSAAADKHRGSHVFDDVLGTEDSWQSSTQMPAPAADPTVGLDDDAPGADPDHEPEVFKLNIEDEDAPARAAPADATAADADDVDEPEPFRFAAGPATTAPAAVPDHVPAEGRDEPDLFAFAFDAPGEDTGGQDEADAGARTEDGRDATLAAETTPDDAAAEPAPLEDPMSEEPDVNEDTDGDVWAAAESDDASDPWASATDDQEPVWEQATEDAPWSADASPVEPVETTDVADAAQDDPDDGAWTFDIGPGAEPDAEPEGEEVDEDVEDDDHEPTLAETARPRADTGWTDRSEEQSTWSLDPVPSGDSEFASEDATAPDPDGFTAVLDDADEFSAAHGDAAQASTDRDTDADDGAEQDEVDDGFLPDDEPLAPTREPDPPFQTESADLGDVIEDLLNDIPATTPAQDDEGDRDEDPLDALDDALAGLDQFDDIGATAPEATASAPTDAPADLADLPPPVRAPATPPPAGDEPTTDAPIADADAEPAPQEDAAERAVEDDDEPDDDAASGPDEPAPPAVPPGMTFSSKPKKRGLFGR